jgi:hypothetical protein
MSENDPGHAGPAGPQKPATAYQPFRRFLRVESVWPLRAWIFFCCAMILCTMQAVPSWVHPDWRWGWDLEVCYGILASCGAVTGFVVARYRLLGLLAGAVAGAGSVLSAVLILERLNPFSRYTFAMAALVGLLPGVAVYWALHVITDRLRPEAPEQS